MNSIEFRITSSFSSVHNNLITRCILKIAMRLFPRIPVVYLYTSWRIWDGEARGETGYISSWVSSKNIQGSSLKWEHLSPGCFPIREKLKLFEVARIKGENKLSRKIVWREMTLRKICLSLLRPNWFCYVSTGRVDISMFAFGQFTL